jgi:hypothetical protein
MVLPLLERLHWYIVQAEVTLADASDYFARIALQTDDAAVIEHPLMPENAGSVLQNDSVISLQLEPLAGQRRFLLLCLAADEAIKLWNKFSSQLQVAGFRALRLSEIKAGIPVIYPATSEDFVLQMVARMQYLGKLKRRMFLARLDTDQLPQPGDALVTEGKTEVDGSGIVVDAQFDQYGVCHCLYIAQIAKAETGKLRLLTQSEVCPQNLDLPYPINASI